MTERTKGFWKIDKIATAGGAPIIVSDKCWLGGKRHIAKVLYHSGSEDPEVYPNAKFICLAVNYHDRLVEALKETVKQISMACETKDCRGIKCSGCVLKLNSSTRELLSEIKKESK